MSRTALIFPSSSGSRSSHLPIRSIRSIWRSCSTSPRRRSKFSAMWTPSRRSSTICSITPSNSPAKIHRSPFRYGRTARRPTSPSGTAAAPFRRRRSRSSSIASTSPTAAAARIATASVSGFISSKPF